MEAQGTENLAEPHNPPTSSTLPESSSSGSVKKSDPAWQYVSIKKEGKVNVFTCLLCSSSYRGGGINRLKQHLAGVSGQVSSCIEGAKKKPVHNVKERTGKEIVIKESTASERKTSGAGRVDNYFAPRTTPGSQPSIKSAWVSQEAIHNAKMAFADGLL